LPQASSTFTGLRRFSSIVALSVIAPLVTISFAKNAVRRPLDADYVDALGSADRFLQAWQSGDEEEGIAFLTENAKKHRNAGDLERFFSLPRRAAFEIDRGKKLSRGRYRFPIVLVMRSADSLHRTFSSIVVVNTGKGEWAIDKLP